MLKLPSIFSDGAVFQRRKPIPVWGWTDPNTLLECRFGSHKLYTASSLLSGKFSFTLPPMEADFPPRTLTICNLSTKEEFSFGNILLGEVWLASGQSNMEFTLSCAGLQMEEFQKEELSEQEIDTLRMFTVKKDSLGIAQDDCKGKWEVSENDLVPDWSAVGLWFGRKLQKELSIPIGIIHSSWGGTIVETWTGPETFLQEEFLKDRFLAALSDAQSAETWKESASLLESHTAPHADFQAYFKNNCVTDKGLSDFAAEWMKPELDTSDWKDVNVPGDWVRQQAGEHGAFWLRKSVIIPESWENCPVTLRMPTLDKQDTSYFNGTLVGASGKEFEYAGFFRKYPIAPELIKPGRAVIAIRIFSFIYGAGVYGSREECFLENGKTGERIPLDGVWKGCQETVVPVPGNLYASGGGDFVCNPNAFSNLYNGMIHPLVPYALSGVIWYQGESNSGMDLTPGETLPPSVLYKERMEAMIRDWRFRWGEKDLPFLMVGLAGYEEVPEYDENSSWARLRESQRKCALELDNVHIASAVDCGDRDDIHPKDKRTVGYRLAFQALYHVYHKDSVTPCGPVPVRKRIEGKALRIEFDFADGMKSSDGKKIRGFYIAGTDEKFFPCEAVVEGRSLLLSCEKVPSPCSVRYGWSDFPVCTLVNSADLPAFPFELQ
ncbi:MAG: hypothetical protein J6331_07080 [Lentisphaeria bacterium]|nr:hypothetical protein [Lentisphaeria bacterium]